MLKSALLSLADNARMRDFVVQNRLTRGISRRFVAGEALDDALQATRVLNKNNIQVALDHLGENVANEDEAKSATAAYIAAMNLVKRTAVKANMSIKLTALGLDISQQLCEANLYSILEHARETDIFVCIDMEGSAYTERTIEMVLLCHERYEQVGTVIQSYLLRTSKDVEQLIAQGVRVRLVKGAYLEPADVAFQDKAKVDQNYVQLMTLLLARGNYPAIATHDEAIITATCKYARDHGIDKGTFEFQMLYGIRRDLQEKLVKQGYNVRVYLPYGSQWYPYLVRRMAERPSNLMFVMSNAMR